MWDAIKAFVNKMPWYFWIILIVVFLAWFFGDPKGLTAFKEVLDWAKSLVQSASH